MKVIGLSVDATDKHAAWADDIEETQGARPNYPIIGDADFNVSKLYGMLPASTSGDSGTRTPADNQTVRNVFVIGPDKKVKLVLVYPMTTGRNFDEVLRVIDSLQLTAKHRVATPVNWKQGEDVIIAGSVSNDEAKEIYGTLEGAEAVHPDRSPAPVLSGPLSTSSPRPTPARPAPVGRGAPPGSVADHRRAHRHGLAFRVDDDRLGTEPVGELAHVVIRREHDVRPVVVRPLRPEQRHPLLPQLGIAEVGVEIVADLDDVDVGMQVGEPTGAQRSGRGVGRSAVDEHHEPVDARGGPVDHVGVPEMGRVEATDDEARRRPHRHPRRPFCRIRAPSGC